MDQFAQIVYVSSTTGLMTETELVELLKQARVKNRQYNISGILLYDAGNVIQVLEGRREDLDKIFSHIEKDRRHSGLIVLLNQSIEEREFGDWNMFYRNVSELEQSISELMEVAKNKTSAENSNQVRLLLDSFLRWSD